VYLPLDFCMIPTVPDCCRFGRIPGISCHHHCKGTSVYLLTLPPPLSPILFYPLNSYSTLCICTHHHQGSTTFISDSWWPLHTKVVDSRLPPPLTPQLPQTSIRYIGTHPRDTMAPSASRGLRVRRDLEAWCCIGYYINVLRPNQGSSEHL
jgi:hypothetical protein